MDPRVAARHARLMDAFDAACELAAPERRSFVAALRAEDAELARALEAMLEQDAGGSPLDRPLAALPLEPTLVPAASAAPDDAVLTVAPVRVGSQLGRYVVGEELGRGGLGTVHRARDTATGADVAIKFLRFVNLSEPRHAQRLQREFQAIRRLDHPNCVRALDDGVGRFGYFLVMEYVGGGNLVRHAGAPNRLLCAIFRDVAAALAHVHEHGIVHRDVKPSNVLLTAEEPPRAKLADFGIANLASGGARLTRSGSVPGTLDFLAPEQVKKLTVGPAADLYALGCTIHSTWTGKPPFEGDNFERMYNRLKSAPPWLCDVAPAAPPEMAALVRELTRVDPAARPSASAVAQTLDAMLEHQSG